MLFQQTKIDKLAKRKKNLTLLKEKLQRDMRGRNSKREAKIHLLENKAQNDYEETNKKVIEIDRQLEKCVRDIDSEQKYVNQVAEDEKKSYENEQNEEKNRKILKGLD
jgi:hypothetical protein